MKNSDKVTADESLPFLLSQSVNDDETFSAQGHTFLGVAELNGVEVHVFLRKKLEQSCDSGSSLSTQLEEVDVLDALETLIGHASHYASFPLAHSAAHRDVANASAALKKGRAERLARLRTS